jgi:membrane-bound serine protease (ClpP class)
MLPFYLAAIGYLLIFLEFFLPGAILGTLGGISLVVSIYYFAIIYPFPLWIVLYVLGIILLLPLVFKFALWKIRTAKPDYSIYSGYDQEGYVASTYDKTAIGKVGTVLTDLKPGGHILIEGKKHAAISMSGYVPKGEEIIVVSGDGESLNVKLHKKEK